MNAKSFSIKWAIVDGYKVIRKIHNDAKKSFENAVYSENFWVSEVDRYLSELVAPSFCTNSWNFLRNLDLKMLVRHQRLLTSTIKL